MESKMRYLFLIFMLFLISGCGGEGRFHANPIPDDEETTDLDGETQTDIDDTQVDQIDIDADEPIDDSESIDDIDIDDVEQIDEDDTEADDKDVVIEFDHPITQQDEDNEEPDESVDEDVEPSTCGNGVIDAGEQCDPNFPDTELSCVGRTIMVASNYNDEQTVVTGGNIKCNSDCSMDFSQCQVHPNFKIVIGYDKTAILMYVGPDNKALPLQKKYNEFADHDLRSSQCKPIYEEYGLNMTALNYYLFKQLVNNNSNLSNKIKNTCKLRVGTDYPDKDDQSYLTDDFSGRDQFKEDCYDEDNTSHIFYYPFDASVTYLLNDFMDLYSPQTEQPDRGFYGVDFKKGMVFVHDDVLKTSSVSSEYRIICSIRLIHEHNPNY
jgi:predicted small lipoprotein YifL